MDQRGRISFISIKLFNCQRWRDTRNTLIFGGSMRVRQFAVPEELDRKGLRACKPLHRENTEDERLHQRPAQPQGAKNSRAQRGRGHLPARFLSERNLNQNLKEKRIGKSHS